MEYLIDTSSLIEAFERSYFDRLTDDPRVEAIIVPGFVMRELESLGEGSGSRARNARAAVRFARQTLKVGREPAAQSHVDDALLERATNKLGVISQDHELIARAKKRGIPTLTLTRSGSIGD